MTRKIQFGLGILGNLILIYLFGSALLDPINHGSFIASINLSILIFELLSIHASIIIASSYGIFIRLGLVVFYGLFAGIYFLIFKDLTVPLIFLASVVAKSLASGKGEDQGYLITMGRIFVILVVSIALIIWAGPIIKETFPFPESVTPVVDPNVKITELYVENTAALIAWGAVYYIMLAIFEIYNFFATRPANK